MNFQPHADLGLTCTTSTVLMTCSLLSRLQTFQTTSSKGVLCDKYGVKTLEYEGVCMAVCLQHGQ